jgi:glycosyltransferase involved in cell wall biosynthesis
MARPRISICIPLHNGVRWIDGAIESALSQTRTDFELLVVDGGSTDGSVELVRAWLRKDKRIRVEVGSDSGGAVANHDRCIRLAQGELVKFLHQDDLLAPTCLERLAATFDAHQSVGLAFCRREILLDQPGDPREMAWKEEYEELHTGFSALAPFNRGRDLLEQYLPTFGDPRYRNWIGEPSAVMVRRPSLERVGTFNDRMWQSWDLELWLRLMAVDDVAFIDEKLVTFRHHTESLTAANSRQRTEWLDLLWLYEGLLAEPGLEQYHGMIRSFRRRRTLAVVKRQLERLRRGDLDLRPLGLYFAHRTRVMGIQAVPL